VIRSPGRVKCGHPPGGGLGRVDYQELDELSKELGDELDEVLSDHESEEVPSQP
jgi:hypothetical protein